MNDILFWSGGKDSYLALEFFRQKHTIENLLLLTTFERKSKRVPHQDLPLKTIEKQADALSLTLLKVPLPPNCPNQEYTSQVKKTLTRHEPIRYLIFGDWHLEDIRKWREKVFGQMGYRCLFPIWEKPLDELLPVLLLKPIEIKISAVKKDYQKFIGVGETYNQHFIRQLPDEIDPMGENGEFHTEVIFKEWQKPEEQSLF